MPQRAQPSLIFSWSGTTLKLALHSGQRVMMLMARANRKVQVLGVVREKTVPRLGRDLHNQFNLDASAQGDLRHAKSAARMHASGAKDFAQ